MDYLNLGPSWRLRAQSRQGLFRSDLAGLDEEQKFQFITPPPSDQCLTSELYQKRAQKLH